MIRGKLSISMCLSTIFLPLDTNFKRDITKEVILMQLKMVSKDYLKKSKVNIFNINIAQK